MRLKTEERSRYVKTQTKAAIFPLSGALAKLRKATVSIVMSVCLSSRTEELSSRWTDLCKISYLGIFRKYVEKTHVRFKSDKNYGYFT
jgi:hypothetical protein